MSISHYFYFLILVDQFILLPFFYILLLNNERKKTVVIKKFAIVLRVYVFLAGSKTCDILSFSIYHLIE